MKKPAPPRCIGFGKQLGKCTKKPLRVRLWCASCDRLRIAHLDKRFEQIDRAFRDPDAE